MKNIKKRDFLKLLVLSAVPGGVARAEALNILEHLKKEKPTDFEQSLISNPQKQILIAEKMGCPFTSPSKGKCISLS